jgi:hypothetical protein
MFTLTVSEQKTHKTEKGKSHIFMCVTFRGIFHKPMPLMEICGQKAIEF